MKRSSVILLAAAVAACGGEPEQLVQPDEAGLVESSSELGAADVIPGRFIVTLREDAAPESVARDHGVQPDFVYTHALRGFAGPMSEAARSGLMRDGRVLDIEPDRVMRAVTTQSNATWGLDRIDQTSRTLSGTFNYTNTGAGVRAYIIDTGIDTGHSEFGGRASSGTDTVGDGRNGDDCNGHGTHVAGTVGGATWGVAKGVSLVAVRVLNCDGSGTNSGVIAGIDWVTANRVLPAVANMSLGGSASSAVDTAVQNMINAGVATAVAAGNGVFGGLFHANACNYSPARVAAAMTVSATDSTDKKASWANYGNCVDWFAPGVSITSAWIGNGTTETNTISGTSMATPHTAGVAALYLQGNPGASPQTVRDALFARTTRGIVTSSSTTNNHLLFTDY